MKNPLARPRCPHGKTTGSRCDPCGYWAQTPPHWFWDNGLVGGPRDRWIFIGVPAAVVTFAAGLMFTGLLLAHISASRECSRYERISEVNTDYGFFGGCLVETEDGNWVSLYTYKNQHNVKIR